MFIEPLIFLFVHIHFIPEKFDALPLPFWLKFHGQADWTNSISEVICSSPDRSLAH